MKELGILLFLIIFFAVLVGLPVFLGIKIFKGVKQRGLAVRDIVTNGKRATARVVGTRMDTGGRGLRRVVEYEFEVKGQTFRGDLADRELENGARIEIEYDATDPANNSPAGMIAEARRKGPEGMGRKSGEGS